MTCHYCGSSSHEMRPYGPGGTSICYACATSTPEREAEAARNFLAQVLAAGPVVVLGGPEGPYPLHPRRRDN